MPVWFGMVGCWRSRTPESPAARGYVNQLYIVPREYRTPSEIEVVERVHRAIN
jgi:hypothetical protein